MAPLVPCQVSPHILKDRTQSLEKLHSGSCPLYGPEQRGRNIPADWEPVLFQAKLQLRWLELKLLKNTELLAIWTCNCAGLHCNSLKKIKEKASHRYSIKCLKFKVCTEAVHCVALWTQRLSQVWARSSALHSTLNANVITELGVCKDMYRSSWTTRRRKNRLNNCLSKMARKIGLFRSSQICAEMLKVWESAENTARCLYVCLSHICQTLQNGTGFRPPAKT